jgi:hypothetical protein
MLVLFTAPLCADLGNKTPSDATADKVGQVKKGDKSLPDVDKSKNGTKKDASSVKKNAAKKTGAAAAAGLATKKVTSEIKK